MNSIFLLHLQLRLKLQNVVNFTYLLSITFVFLQIPIYGLFIEANGSLFTLASSAIVQAIRFRFLVLKILQDKCETEFEHFC